MSNTVMSWYNIYTVLFFLVISRSFQTAPITKRTFLFRYLDLDNKVANGINHASSSLWECAGICSAHSGCKSVAFIPGSATCVIYEKLPSISNFFSVMNEVTVYGVCPTGFSAMGTRCIKVVMDLLDWNSARERCRLDNADFITLDSQAKMGELRDVMVANDHGSYWIGASKVNDGWQWINGITFPYNSDVWCDAQVNSTAQMCGSVVGEGPLCLYDFVCEMINMSVCEIQLY